MPITRGAQVRRILFCFICEENKYANPWLKVTLPLLIYDTEQSFSKKWKGEFMSDTYTLQQFCCYSHTCFGMTSSLLWLIVINIITHYIDLSHFTNFITCATCSVLSCVMHKYFDVFVTKVIAGTTRHGWIHSSYSPLSWIQFAWNSEYSVYKVNSWMLNMTLSVVPSNICF